MEFRKRFCRKRPAHFKSGQWHFHQDIAPVHNSIFVTDYLTQMGIKTVPHPPYCPNLAPCDCWLFPKLRGNWGDERGCDKGHWHAHRRRLVLGLVEVVGTIQQEHCSQRRLLQRGLDFHMCTINKSAHTKKRLETNSMILVFLKYICKYFSSSSISTTPRMHYMDAYTASRKILMGTA